MAPRGRHGAVACQAAFACPERVEPGSFLGSVPSTFDGPEVHISYRATASLGPEAVEAALATLSTDERLRCESFHFAADRRDYASAHELLRRCLSMHGGRKPTDWRFRLGRTAKPYIAPSSDDHTASLSFNLSHARGLVACAITRELPVGIDVERTDRSVDVNEISDACFSPFEVFDLNTCPHAARGSRFAELWTLKEAVLKATGDGLARRLDGLTFRLENASFIEFQPTNGLAPSDWHFVLFAPTADTRLAVAVRGAGHVSFAVHLDSTEETRTTSPLAELRLCRGCRAAVASVDI